MTVRTFTAVIHEEGGIYVANCPEVGTVSQCKTPEEARENLREATELYHAFIMPQVVNRPQVATEG